ncbi:MAG: hypothetical protein HOQ09_09710, partial [Gemmatimonadaceae bacterium]|nr:hypothetical protein [Gemmatimonadaceae bacterium]
VVGHSVHVSVLQIPAGVTVLAEPDAPIALVQLSRASVEVPVIAEGEEAASAEPELIRKPKEEGEGEEK